MALTRKKKRDDEGGGGDGWLATYADMITLLLCFFAILFNPIAEEKKEDILQAISDYFSRAGMGYSLSPGRLASSGNTIMSLPAQSRGRALGDALRMATSLFTPQIRSNQVKVTQDERGLVITLASDVFFNPASATLNLETSRSVLLNLATLLTSEEVEGRKFRIEGHSDSASIDPDGPWVSNWQLSTERALSVLYFLSSLGIPEKRMYVTGFGDTMPVSSNDTPEGRAYNRRVDIIILSDGHL
ncbi:MAG: flagellar motor protein MotB [Treponema sp.]|jgi:chemotaxis protein MotB|nr:flagellar motor protein MotB [Treponema sp.]